MNYTVAAVRSSGGLSDVVGRPPLPAEDTIPVAAVRISEERAPTLGPAVRARRLFDVLGLVTARAAPPHIELAHVWIVKPSERTLSTLWAVVHGHVGVR